MNERGSMDIDREEFLRTFERDNPYMGELFDEIVDLRRRLDKSNKLLKLKTNSIVLEINDRDLVLILSGSEPECYFLPEIPINLRIKKIVMRRRE